MKPNAIKTMNIQLGDIIVTNRFLYRHYGIYAGNGRVIHYAAENGDFGADVKVRETSLEQFAHGGECKRVLLAENRTRSGQFSPEETISRAKSRMGEKHYDLLFNNCEHFAYWCKSGTNKSVQVEKAVSAAVILGTAIVVANVIKSVHDYY